MEAPTQITRRYVSPTAFPGGRDYGQFTPGMMNVQAAMMQAQMAADFREKQLKQAEKASLHEAVVHTPAAAMGTPMDMRAMSLPGITSLPGGSYNPEIPGAQMPMGYPMYGHYGMAVPGVMGPNPYELVGQAPGQYPPLLNKKA